MSARIAVVLVDDHAVLRAGLRLLINSEPDMEVVEEARDGEAALLAIARRRADVAVVDLSMPGTDSAALIETIRKRHPAIRILVLTMHDDIAYLRSSLGAGASGFLVKRAADTELISAIRAVHAGRTFVDASLKGHPLEEWPGIEAAPAADHLSARELEVIKLITAGHTHEEVAKRLNLTAKTVETYRTRIARKLKVHTRAELVSYALRTGLLHPETDR